MAAPARRAATALVLAVCCTGAIGYEAPAQARETLSIRGRSQALHVYGTRGGTPVIVSSGDGGWIHLGPRVAEMLAARGFFVVGFDVRAYLESFTTSTGSLRVEDEPGDFKMLVDFASRGATRKPILIGVSEGAGLSVLAASAPQTKAAVAGVIGLGLSNANELGWRWKDAVIYLTHGTPSEPSFSAAGVVGRVAPVPLGLIHSTHDEFAPLAEAEQVLDHAQQPKRLWIVSARDHRFSGNLEEFDHALFDAIAWVGRTAPN